MSSEGGATVYRLIAAFFVLCFAAVTASAGKFAGNLEFVTPGCEASGKCILKAPFGYKDSTGKEWEASAGNSTDGASIPPKLQGYAGKPFDPDLLRAAVIHDHYCDRHVRSWRDTHWVFYDALLASGLEKKRAAAFYLGVLIGGPKWIWVMNGTSCDLFGDKCVKQVQGAKIAIQGQIVDKADSAKVIFRPARYGEPEFETEMKKAEEFLNTAAEPSPADMEEFAKSLRPGDKFLNGPDRIVSPGGAVLE